MAGWKITVLMLEIHLHSWSMFHCYVRLPECNSVKKWLGGWDTNLKKWFETVKMGVHLPHCLGWTWAVIKNPTTFHWILVGSSRDPYKLASEIIPNKAGYHFIPPKQPWPNQGPPTEHCSSGWIQRVFCQDCPLNQPQPPSNSRGPLWSNLMKTIKLCL